MAFPLGTGVTLVLRKSVYTKTVEQHSDVSSPKSLLDMQWDVTQRLAKWISGRLALLPSLLLPSPPYPVTDFRKD